MLFQIAPFPSFVFEKQSRVYLALSIMICKYVPP
jgi:hypothetical protein